MNTTKRGIPLKIENDSIIDSIIFLKFETDFNQKKIESVLVSFLKKTFSDNPFFSTPLRKKDTESMDNHEKDGQFYSNGVVKVLVDGDRLVVNCLNKYPGWKNVLGQFVCDLIHVFQQKYVHFTEVGVRYISLLKGESLIENLDGEIRFNNFKVFNGATYNFSCDVSDGKHSAQVKVRLTEKAKYESGFASIVDIEVFANTANMSSITVNGVCEYVFYCHYVEKDIFYRLLSDSYVDSHNPVWK